MAYSAPKKTGDRFASNPKSQKSDSATFWKCEITLAAIIMMIWITKCYLTISSGLQTKIIWKSLQSWGIHWEAERQWQWLVATKTGLMELFQWILPPSMRVRVVITGSDHLHMKLFSLCIKWVKKEFQDKKLLRKSKKNSKKNLNSHNYSKWTWTRDLKILYGSSILKAFSKTFLTCHFSMKVSDSQKRQLTI